MRIIAGYLAFLVGIISVFVPRFAHPELTETQLFIEYWDVFLCGVAWCILGFVLLDKKVEAK
ncbi:MAG: hypothetical protein ABUJ92_00210 [Desulfobacterales bacterium]